jgi:hypothetical protein
MLHLWVLGSLDILDRCESTRRLSARVEQASANVEVAFDECKSATKKLRVDQNATEVLPEQMTLTRLSKAAHAPVISASDVL